MINETGTGARAGPETDQGNATGENSMMVNFSVQVNEKYYK